MNSKRRCQQCHDYFPVEEMQVSGLGAVCVECKSIRPVLTKTKQPTPAKPKRPRKRKKKRPYHGANGELKDKVRTRDGYACFLCRSSYNIHVHHVDFLSQGGANNQSNLITLCSDCHINEAHGEHAAKYRRVFKAYIWKLLVEGERLAYYQLKQYR